MAITSLDQYIAGYKQSVPMSRMVATPRTTVANGWFTVMDQAGQPGAGTLAGVGANGAVQDDATAGYPQITDFAALAKGYISRLEYSNTVACRLTLFDCLWKGGTYAFNANQAVTQPSIAARVPNSDYRGLELWAEAVTAFTGNQTWNVTYTDQDGNTGATTGATGIGAAPTVGRCFQLPLASGDSGVRAVSNVQGGTGSAGTANILLLRPLVQVRINAANYGDVMDLLRTGMPEIFQDSALMLLCCPDSTSLGNPDVTVDVVSG